MKSLTSIYGSCKVNAKEVLIYLINIVMETKVTFISLTKKRSRVVVNGIMIKGKEGITKNTKKTRFIIIRAHDNERIQAMKEEEKRKEVEERKRKYYGNWY